MAEVLSLSRVAKVRPDSALWQFLAHHQSHVAWIGCSLHDLIQPSFRSWSAWRCRSRWRAGRPAASRARAWSSTPRGAPRAHPAGRLPAVDGAHQTYWTFEDTLSQIGLGYVALFLLGFRPAREQWAALGLILAGYWAALALYPLPGPEFEYSKVGVPNTWPHLMTGFAAHWNKNSNLAWLRYLVSQPVPSEKPFAFNGGGYATLSFIPTLGTMILGLIAGGVVRSQRAPWAKCGGWLSPASSGWLQAQRWAGSGSARSSSASGRRAGCSIARLVFPAAGRVLPAD